MEITAIQFATVTETAYLLCTIDDMGESDLQVCRQPASLMYVFTVTACVFALGVARVFGMYSESIHLLSVINAMVRVVTPCKNTLYAIQFKAPVLNYRSKVWVHRLILSCF